MNATPDTDDEVRLSYAAMVQFTASAFGHLGVPEPRATMAAEALCYADLAGIGSHGVANLDRIYVPALRTGRIDPRGEPRTLADGGPTVLLDARRSLGLWQASAAMDLAVQRAGTFGVGMVWVRNATHIGSAGFHALRAVARGLIGVVASNCGRQRIARPPGGGSPMLGTNPLCVAAPAGGHPPFCLDMSTTVVPTGKIRAAARAGHPVPPGWLVDDAGRPVTDPAAFDRGEAHLLWLGGDTATGGYKGFGLGLAVEVLTALVSGSGRGADAAAVAGDAGCDDDIGVLVFAVDPAVLRPRDDVASDADQLFGAVLSCPPTRADQPVRYPGWHEAYRSGEHRRSGVVVPAWLYEDLVKLAAECGIDPLLASGPAPEAPAPASVQAGVIHGAGADSA